MIDFFPSIQSVFNLEECLTRSMCAGGGAFFVGELHLFHVCLISSR